MGNGRLPRMRCPYCGKIVSYSPDKERPDRVLIRPHRNPCRVGDGSMCKQKEMLIEEVVSLKEKNP